MTDARRAGAEEAVLGLLAEVSELDRESITRGMDLAADLGLDSAKALRLLLELEERLGIELEDEDAARLSTVGDVLDHVARAAPGGS